MGNITVNMMGTFSVSADGRPKDFQYKKVEALFCYLAVKKHAARDELANLLWADKDEETARKNLRNAIYKLKLCFEEFEDFLVIGKSVIELSPVISIESDMERFLCSSPDVSAYQGDFLQNFAVKDALQFENWASEVRSELKGIYIQRLNRLAEEDKKSGSLADLEKHCRLLIRADEFDEGAYRNLMDCYRQQGDFNKSLEVYDQLSELLEQELSITPEVETEKVFSEILKEMHVRHKGQEKKMFFFGRKWELSLIDRLCASFLSGDGGKAIILRGEMGIGKTWLKDTILAGYFKGSGQFLFEVPCYQFEKEHTMKTWKEIILFLLQTIREEQIEIPSEVYQLSQLYRGRSGGGQGVSPEADLEGLTDILGNDSLEDFIAALFNLLTARKRLVLVFEDIHWMDADSIATLTRMILRMNRERVMLLITCRDERSEALERFYAFVEHSVKAEVIDLERYSVQEVEGFIKKALPDLQVSKDVLGKIFAETEGNPFFLSEYLNVLNSEKAINIMTSEMHHIIESKFWDLGKEEKKIAEITSLFDDGAPLFIFKELLHLDELEIIDVIEALENKSILRTIANREELCFAFTHRKLREFQYMALSPARKRILHDRVGGLLEQRLINEPGNLDLYYQIIYHFENASNDIAAMKYRLKILNIHLDFSHERFPVLYFENKVYNQFDFDEKRTTKKIEAMEEMLDRIKKDKSGTLEVLNLEMVMLHIKGRHMIRRGVYEEGLQCIKDMMETADELGDTGYLMEGCKQVVLYCIQTNSPDTMIQYINRGYELAQKQNSVLHKAMFIRFHAVYEIVSGNVETAEASIEDCIRLLSQSTRNSNRYLLHIAACYDEMGGIKRMKGEFIEALDYYEKAIALCEKSNVWISVSLFYTHAGEIACWLGQDSLARQYFLKALKVFDKIEYNAGQPIAESYMALLLLKEGDYKAASQYLQKADRNVSALKIPKELGTVLRIKCEFKSAMEKFPELKEILNGQLTEPREELAAGAIQALKEAKEGYQLQMMEQREEMAN